MNRIDEVILKIKKEGRKAVAASIVAGDSSIEFSKKVISDIDSNGVDFIVIGVPFSDPSAETIVVQASHLRAMNGGTDIFKTLELVDKLRNSINSPIVLSLYYNVMVQYGIEEFFKKCKESGVDALVIFDLPFEEYSDISEFVEKYGVYQIHIITGANRKRAKMISKTAKSFLFGIGVSEDLDLEIPVYTLDEYSSDGIIVKEEIAKILNTDLTDSEKSNKINEKIRSIKLEI